MTGPSVGWAGRRGARSSLGGGAVTDALTGLVVVDFSDTLPGALASQLFCDFGAEVVVVERPGGSALRSQQAAPFWFRGKQSVELDLKDPVDRDVARTLASGA